jgi:hypothetical protein
MPNPDKSLIVQENINIGKSSRMNLNSKFRKITEIANITKYPI